MLKKLFYMATSVWTTALMQPMLANASPIATGGFATANGSIEPAVVVSSLNSLKSAFNQRKHHIIVSGLIYGGPKLTTLTFSTLDWSNTTIEGAPGGKAALENIQLKFDGELLEKNQQITNIVVKNINFFGNIIDLQKLPPQIFGSINNEGINYEGISLRRINNAWIDHCSFKDMSDDLMSITLGSDNITVSYNHFYFSANWLHMNPDPVWNWVGKNQDLANERLALVVGANPTDSYLYGAKALHVTLHHNWIGPLIKGRPLLRGWVHAYDNFFDNSDPPQGTTYQGGRAQQYNSMQIGSGGVVYSEMNYFYMTNNSNQIGLDPSRNSYQFYEKNNVYVQTTGRISFGQNFDNVSVNYAYQLDPEENINNFIKNSAGPK
ncbi:hypothetical protein [Gluconobacter kondonii]|uniref:hypothetical protein n=1 Tax=Gluconobacter kondonii TaxID=941463 RepID=UPI001B8AF9EA|nr:hypothetical protein [Gluconobacter kondonii]MBS1054662.1 hypothetical protein [Gluconobacter kondonii]